MPRVKYQTNDGTVGLTAVGKGFEGPEVYGVEPGGAAVQGFYIPKAGSRRKATLKPRYLICSINDGGLTPSGAQPKRFSYVSVGTQNAFSGYAEGEEINLPGGVYTIKQKVAEG